MNLYRKLVLASVVWAIYVVSLPAQNIYISPMDPINDRLEELAARGYLRDINLCERPWLRSDIIRSIRSDESRFDPVSRRIASDILKILKPPQRKRGMSGSFTGGFDLRAISRERKHGYFILRDRYIDRGFKGELGSAFKGGWWVSRDSLWGIDTRMIYDTDGTGYPWYFGRPREARTTVQFDHAYFAVRFRDFDLMLGRQRISWGPSPRGSLLIDGNSPPYDMYMASGRIFPFKLTWFGSRLDDYAVDALSPVQRRYFSGHRLSLNTGRGWEIGLSEVVLYGGEGRLPEIYYNIPITLFYWEAHNHKVDDNILWNLDFSFTKSSIGRFYLQFVADDIQYKNRGPQKFVIQLGSHLAPAVFPKWTAIAEINMIDTYVYGQRKRRNAYLDWNQTIGRLGSDQYELFFGLYRDIRTYFRTGFEYTMRGKGEYDIRVAQDFSLSDDIKFPSGIVEGTNDIRLSASLKAASKARFYLAVGYQTIDNFNHSNGNNYDQFYSMFDMTYTFDIGLPFWTRYR